MTVPRRPRVVAARGPRAAQDQLLADLAQTLGAGPLAPASLAAPVRVITATGALRRQLAHRICLLHDGAAAGVQVVTLWSLTRQVLQAASEALRVGDGLMSLLASRQAAIQAGLSAALNPFEDGPRAVTPAVRDLLSAGLVSGVPAREALAELGRGDDTTRARALVEVAASVSETMKRLGAPRFGAHVRRAAELLGTPGHALLPSRAVMVIGFADATGDALCLLQTLCAQAPASLYLDVPDDPAYPGHEDLGARFARRFASRLLPEAEWFDAPASPTQRQRLLVDAAGIDAEVRETASRVRRLLDAKIAPESIGVVVRGAEAYATVWRRHADALGIPFSGGETPEGATVFERRLQSFVRVMRDGPSASIDAWLDAGFAHGLPASNDDLRLALRAIGVSRLEEVARLDLAHELGGRDSLPLPVRRGFLEVEENDERRIVVSRRHVAAKPLRAVIAAAAATLTRLKQRHDSLQQHAEAMRQTVVALPKRERDALSVATDTLLKLAGADFVLLRDEFLRLLADALGSQIDRRLGGDGGGVQWLDTARARGLSFEHLFVLGVNRDVFPGALHDDAMLDESVRARLQRVLPDLALKSARHDEERLLFASLLAAAPSVTLSWQRADDEGKERAVSAFIERLLLADGELSIEHVPRARVDQLARWPARTARESLQLAALTRDEASFARWLPLALNEGQQRFATAAAQRSQPVDAELVARARIAVLGEQEPNYETSLRFGPYLGFAGTAQGSSDPRRGPLSITTLESVARCGWQALLANYLKLERPPDPAGELPGIGNALVGDAAHRALQRLLEPRIGSGEATRPSDREIDEAVSAAAPVAARESGLRLSGLIDVLARRASAMVHRAIALEWGARATLPTVHVEFESSTSLVTPHGNVAVRFRADRVDRDGAKQVFTDYKTGKPLSSGKKAQTRDLALMKAVKNGTKLQAAVYALSQPGAVGRYLYIDPSIEADCTEFAIEHDSAAAQAARVSAALLTTALQQGVLLPRLFDHKGNIPNACEYCDVKAACSQGDTGVALRLQRVFEALRERRGDPPLALQLWDIGVEGEQS